MNKKFFSLSSLFMFFTVVISAMPTEKMTDKKFLQESLYPSIVKYSCSSYSEFWRRCAGNGNRIASEEACDQLSHFLQASSIIGQVTQREQYGSAEYAKRKSDTFKKLPGAENLIKEIVKKLLKKDDAPIIMAMERDLLTAAVVRLVEGEPSKK